MRFFKASRNLRMVVLAGVIAAVLGSSFAVASSLVTSKDIKNGTIKPADLSKKLRRKIGNQTAAAAIPGQQGAVGAEGKRGPEGARGPEGNTGPAGTPAAVGLKSWGPMVRNEYGSPVAETGNTSTGQPALILAVACQASPCQQANLEKAEYGTETEFTGLELSEIHELGFDALITDADVGFGNYQPNIQMEVNPKVAGQTYSSLAWEPPLARLVPNQFSGYIDALAPVTDHGTEGWYFSKAAVATATNCTQAHLCSWSEVLAAAPDAEVSVAVGIGKGRDSQFEGLIREFRLNGVYTFGPGGTFKG